jgi:hypothetical protein
MEQLATVSALSILVAARWIWLGSGARSSTVAFSAAFSITVCVLFLASVGVERWSTPVCDALSISYLLPALVGGTGLAVIATLSETWFRDRSRRGFRALAVLVLAAIAVGGMAAFSPTCLAGPFAQVDPRLYPVWLDHVEEAQSVLFLSKNSPTDILVFLIPPALVLSSSLIAARHAAPSEQFTMIAFAALLAVALLIAAVQIRGAVTAQCIAAPLAALLIIKLRSSIAANDRSLRGLSYRLGGIIFIPIVWLLVVLFVTDEGEARVHKAEQAAVCRSSLANALGSRPPGVVAASSNLGSFLLATTPHAVLSAPYHRNTEGILAVTDLWAANPQDALKIIERKGIRYIAVCAADFERELFAANNAHGFLASLANSPPEWLSTILHTGDTQLFEVRRRTIVGDRLDPHS